MNEQTLKGFQMLADSMPKAKAKVTYSENGETKLVECDYYPLTGTISLGRIACSKSELPGMVKMIYPKAKIISIELLRTATTEDFKTGTTLITSEGYGFTILRKYDKGIWEARGTEGQGDKCVFEDEARFYKIKI